MSKKFVKKSGKKWWASLTTKEQQDYIEKRERSRKQRTTMGKNEEWTNAAGTFRKTWLNPNSYMVERISN